MTRKTVPQDRKKVQTLSARIRSDLVKALNDVSRETERTMSFHVEKALQLYLNEYADLQIALDRLNDPSDRVISFEDLESEFGLRD